MVGKSCIVSVFVRSTFITDSAYMPTMIDSYRRNVTYDGENVLLDIADTAGDIIYFPVTEDYIRKGDAFFCVFALDDQDSFSRVQFFLDKIKLLNCNDPPIILPDNKSDKDRVVDDVLCKELARQLISI